MVKIPKKGPDWRKIVKEHFKDVFKFPSNAEIQSLIEKSDDQYCPWDKVRSQPLSPEFQEQRERVWAFIRFRRDMNSIPSLIEDVKGKPFKFWLTDSIQKNLHLIDQNTSGNLALTDPGGDKKASAKYMITSLMEEAITSSQIEGAVATIKEAKQMLLSKKRPRNRSEQMIYNNYLTMRSLKDLCKKDLSLELLLELHISITQNTLDDKEDEGKFRTEKDRINVVDPYGEVLFTPPVAEEVKQRLEAMCQFANDKIDKPFIHPVVKAIMLHFWLAYIHPFTDGNGRVARALFYWYLLKHEYWLFEYTSISKAILARTAQYAYAYLHSEHDDNDLTYFIHFNIEVIMSAVKDLKEYIQSEQKKNYQARLEIAEHPDLNIRQTRIVQRMIESPNESLTIKVHKKLNGIAYETARTDLLELVEKGWLKSFSKGKMLYFIPVDNLLEISRVNSVKKRH